jgi:hypothetical protein
MTPFEYIALLTSIVIALGITRILTGFGQVVQHRGRVRTYWVHLLWAVNVLLWLLLNWWILYRWHSFERWTFFLFLFVLISPVLAFLLAVLLFPEPFEAGVDLKQRYYANHRAFFVVAALLPIVDAADTVLKGWTHFVAQGPQYVVTLLVIVVLSVIGAVTKREWFHASFGFFFLFYMLAFITINLRVLT